MVKEYRLTFKAIKLMWPEIKEKDKLVLVKNLMDERESLEEQVESLCYICDEYKKRITELKKVNKSGK